MNAIESEPLRQEHFDLLQAVHDLQGDDVDCLPSTTGVGQRLLEIFRTHPPFAWSAQAPWHGTDPLARELERAGLLQVGSGMAEFHRPDQPVKPVEQFYLGLTDEGRRVLDERVA